MPGRPAAIRIGRAVLTALFFGLAGCGPGEEEQRPDPAELVASDAYRVVDLTHAFDEDTVYWPTAPHGFRLEPLHEGPTDKGFFYRAYRFTAPEHGGTHFDAPSHFHREGRTAEEVSLDRLTGPAAVIDVREEAQADRDYALTVERVKAWEAEHGAVPEGSLVLLRTGWSRHWPDAAAYLGGDSPGELHFPGYGEAAARYLVAERGAALLGIDSASIDPGPAETFPVHQLVAARQVPALENLARLGKLPARGALVAALPVKIKGGSGAPARVVAFVPRQR